MRKPFLHARPLSLFFRFLLCTRLIMRKLSSNSSFLVLTVTLLSCCSEGNLRICKQLAIASYDVCLVCFSLLAYSSRFLSSPLLPQFWVALERSKIGAITPLAFAFFGRGSVFNGIRRQVQLLSIPSDLDKCRRTSDAFQWPLGRLASPGRCLELRTWGMALAGFSACLSLYDAL